MEQISNNVMVLNVGDQIPPGTEDALKIYLGANEVGIVTSTSITDRRNL